MCRSCSGRIEAVATIASMRIEKESLVGALTESMNEAVTLWILAGRYDLQFLMERLLSRVPLLPDSLFDKDGFAYSAGG